ncbi:MAG: hypothetical protein ACXVQU_11795, partial [Actinomycetota bacterium]
MSSATRDDRALVRSLTRWQTAGVVLMLLLVVSFPLYTAVEHVRRSAALDSEQAALLSSGRQLWSLNCVSRRRTLHRQNPLPPFHDPVRLGEEPVSSDIYPIAFVV